jgi:mannose-6-phosphate isomerase-like protein (cupin superfamily)
VSISHVHHIHTSEIDYTEDTRFPGIGIKLLATRETHPTSSVILARVAVGGAIGEHVHPAETETAYVLSGEGILHTTEGDYRFAPGVLVTIPPGVVHRLVNTGDVPLEVFAFHTPPTR